MKRTVRKLFSVLALSLAALCWTGCGAADSVAGTAGSGSAPAQETGTAASPAPAGAYVEEAMFSTLPATCRCFTDLRAGADCGVELVGLSTDGRVLLMKWNGSAWSTAAEAGSPDGATEYLTMTDSGALWAVTRDASGRYTLCTGTDAAAMETVAVSALDGSDALPVGLRLSDDGRVFLTVQVGETTVFVLVDAETRQTVTVTPGFYGSPAFCADGKVYAFTAGSTGLTTFDADTGSALEQQTLPLSDPLPRAGAAAITQNTLIWADKNGIHRIALGGTLQQTLADNRSFTLAGSDFIPQQIALDSQGCFWVSGIQPDGQPRLYRYRYDAQAQVPAGGELVVWAMEDSFLLREAVSAYASIHPELTVTVEYGSDSMDSGLTAEDVIRTLNVEIYAGEGPDVLVLDGLPVESYLDRGVLADLDSVDTDGCYENIVNCYRDASGCRAIPMLFRPCLMYCQSEQNAARLAKAQSLTDLQDLLCLRDDFHYDGYYNLFSELYPAASAAIFAGDAQQINEAALREFLSVTQAVVNAQNITQEFDPLFGDGEDTVSGDDGQHLAVDIPVSMNWYGRAQQPADCAAGSPSDYLLTYLYMVSETRTVPALIRPLPGNVFIPVMTMGVLDASDQKEAGIAFLQTMLSCETEEVAGRGSFNGYFVRRGVQLAKASQRNDGSDGSPTPAQLDLDSVMEQLTTPANTSSSLRDLVYEEACGLYTGQQDLETTVTDIVQRADLYYAEQQ